MPIPDCRCCGASLADAKRLRGRDRLHGLGGEAEVAVCGRCGSGLTLPEVPPERLGALYPDEYAPYELPSSGFAAMASRAIRRTQAAHALRTAPIRALRSRAPGRVVDVGCGRGDLGVTLLGIGWKVTGIEPSRAACT